MSRRIAIERIGQLGRSALLDVIFGRDEKTDSMTTEKTSDIFGKPIITKITKEYISGAQIALTDDVNELNNLSIPKKIRGRLRSFVELISEKNSKDGPTDFTPYHLDDI